MAQAPLTRPGRVVVRRFEASRTEASSALLEQVLGDWAPTPGDVRVVQLCPACASNRHGRPVVVSAAGRAVPWVSIARAGTTVVTAVSDAGPLGVDVEQRGAARAAGLASVVLHPAERATTVDELTTAWVRKESLLKATGHGLRIDPAAVRLSEPGAGPPTLLTWPGAGLAPDSVRLLDLDLGPDHVAAATVLTTGSVSVDVRAGRPGATATPPGRSRHR